MTLYVIEGGTAYLDFYGQGKGHSDRLVYYTDSGTATSGVDFQDVHFSGNSPYYREGQFGFSIAIPTYRDDLFEGDEFFYVNQYDINDGKVTGFETIKVVILDATKKTIFVDLDLDGLPDQIDIDVYNHSTVVIDTLKKIAINSLQRRSVEDKISTLQNAIQKGEIEAALKAAQALGLDAKVLKGALKDYFPAMTDSHLMLAETLYTSVRSGEVVLNDGSSGADKLLASMQAISAWSTQAGHPNAKLIQMLTKAAEISDIGFDLAKLALLREQVDAYFSIQSELLLKSTFFQQIIDAARWVESQIVNAARPDQTHGFSPTLARQDEDGVVSANGYTIRKAQNLIDGERLDVGSFETIIAGGADNFFHFTSSSNGSIVFASAGLDYAVFDGRADEYDVLFLGDGWLIANDKSSNIVHQVERVEFSDGVLAFDLDGNAGQAYRLYQAALERTPDNEGLKYWIGRLDSGDTNLAALADSFINSPEFKSTYGDERSVSNSKFVELLYTHTLGRDYDQDGYSYWVGKLNANETNRRDLLAFFSESNENKAKVYDAISDGIWLT